MDNIDEILPKINEAFAIREKLKEHKTSWMKDVLFVMSEMKPEKMYIALTPQVVSHILNMRQQNKDVIDLALQSMKILLQYYEQERAEFSKFLLQQKRKKDRW